MARTAWVPTHGGASDARVQYEIEVYEDHWGARPYVVVLTPIPDGTNRAAVERHCLEEWDGWLDRLPESRDEAWAEEVW